MKDISPPFVKEISHAETIPATKPLSVQLAADWPTPNWSHHNTEINIDTETNELVIAYQGKRKPGMALQVLESFTANIEVEFPHAGTWKIIVRGRGDDKYSEVEVKST